MLAYIHAWKASSSTCENDPGPAELNTGTADEPRMVPRAQAWQHAYALAALGAAVAAVGGWAIAIIAVCAYIFGKWLKSVITSAGAYIDCSWIGPVAWGR